jgi:hypothetical protein
LEIQHRSFYESVENRHAESDIPSGWAIDHSFLDQLGTGGADAAHIQAGSCGDIARAAHSRAKVGHGSREILFSGREAVETGTGKVLGAAPASKFYSERVRGEV